MKKDSLSPTKLGFETSPPFKRLFLEHFELWCKRTRGDLKDLADKLGVTPSYLSHIKRYGRIPSRPVLILMALLFKTSGEEFFKACGVGSAFPHERGLQITLPSAEEDSVLSLKFNTNLLSETIRTIVRGELRTRNVRDILSGKILKIGINEQYSWLFDKETSRGAAPQGFIPDFCKMLGMTLQKEVELVPVPFSEYLNKLESGTIDLYGPLMITPNLPIDVQFTTPLFQLPVSALFRKKKVTELANLAEPKSIDDLILKPYTIAVVRHSLSHILATTLLKKKDSELVLCASSEEAIERTMLREIPRPVHMTVLNGAAATLAAEEFPKDLSLLFATKEDNLDLAESAFAVRPDWPEVVPVINDAISFLKKRGGLIQRLKDAHKGKLAALAVIE
jgi:ABC-type amino acid transport substrate-binding protein